MIEKAISVIPPRIELDSFSGKKTENFEEKKNEFESHLSKLKKKDDPERDLGGTKKRDPSERQELKAEKPKVEKETEEPEVAKEETKEKYKLEVNEMVLMSMVSPESVIKIPDTEENLVDLEKTNLIEIAAANIPVMTVPTEEVEAAPMTEMALDFQVQPEVAVDSKVLEALNREQHFQKLESIATPVQPEVIQDVPSIEVQPEIAMAEEKPQKLDLKSLGSQIKQMQSEASAKVEQPLQASAVKAPEIAAHSEHLTGQEEQSQTQDEDTTIAKAEAPAHAAPVHHAKDFERTVADVQLVTKTDQPMDTSSNVKEILNQAQYLVTKGGGEVSVKMTPEGMGEVHLKVMLDNGKMSVEMNTHDKNIQKMIQDSLSDLKSSLAAHQISVEHVTLNSKSTVEAMHKSSDMQNSTDARSFSEGNTQNPQSHRERDNRQQASRVFNFENEKAVPVAQAGINKAAAQRVYQMNKAQSLNAVA